MKLLIFLTLMSLIIIQTQCATTNQNSCLTNSTFCKNNGICGINGNCICPRFYNGSSCELYMPVSSQPKFHSEGIASGTLGFVCFMFLVPFPIMLYFVFIVVFRCLSNEKERRSFCETMSIAFICFTCCKGKCKKNQILQQNDVLPINQDVQNGEGPQVDQEEGTGQKLIAMDEERKQSEHDLIQPQQISSQNLLEEKKIESQAPVKSIAQQKKQIQTKPTIENMESFINKNPLKKIVEDDKEFEQVSQHSNEKVKNSTKGSRRGSVSSANRNKNAQQSPRSMFYHKHDQK